MTLDEVEPEPTPPSTVDQFSPSAPPRAGRPSIGLGARFGAFVEVVLCSDVPTQLALIQVLAWIGLRQVMSNGRLSLTYVATLSLVDAVVLIALILWCLHYHHKSPRETFLGTRPIGREACFGMLLVLGVALVVLVTMALVQQFVPWLHNVEENPFESLLQTPRDAWIFSVVAIIAGGVREEIQRAFILRRFEQHLGGASVGLVVFSVAFGAGHLLQGWDAAIVTMILGLVWGVVFLIRRSIIAPLVSHACFNLLEIALHMQQ